MEYDKRVKKKIVFITGTRADYGKMKSLMYSVDNADEFEAYIYVSGMHLMEKYGNTYGEIEKDNYQNIHLALGQNHTNSMSYNVGNVICNLTGYITNIRPDMIVVHGDRLDALAGAIVGAFNNVRVAHIEGGEVSGTIDESIRHAISKFAHLHLVSNENAKRRLIQMGERPDDIYIIGSPDIDIMYSDKLPSIENVKKYYDILYHNYSVFIYHPVTTERCDISKNIKNVIKGLKKTKKNYIVIYPNNDLGSDIIIEQLKELENDSKFKIFPSVRFEYFLTILKNADFIIGNSSSGIREAGIYGIPAIDIGTRQRGRYELGVNKNLQSISENPDEIYEAVHKVDQYRVKDISFGDGNSTRKFMDILRDNEMWERTLQKNFIDLDYGY